MYYRSDPSSDDGNNDFDPDRIFIGRGPQMKLFTSYLTDWKNLMHRAAPDDTPVIDAPSPNNKIAGLVVLLFGRGGFGKSTLLKRYREKALEENQYTQSSKIIISKIRDWEFAVAGKRAIFNPPQGQDIDANDYFKVLCTQLAIALDKDVKEFKEYHLAVQAVEKARKDVNNALESMQKEDRFSWLRGLALEAVSAAVRTYVPGSSVVVDNRKVQEAAGAVARLTDEQITQLHAHLRDRPGSRFGDYLDATLRLGLALGRDLHNFARNYPLLIFFDTYEEIDEGDHLLRIVMKAAGLRVGWVLAGRDNLWAGPEQADRSIGLEYGYKELVTQDYGLSINFNAGDVGAFTPSEIIKYFMLLRQQVQLASSLPEVTEKDAKRIFDVTQGVPLAVKIAANLYLETEDLDPITEIIEGQREIVDQMVRRYLLHTRTDQSERARLYGLAMLRRADQPIAVAAALGLTPEEAKTSYRSDLSRLHRRYSFIFTEKQQPSLHLEVKRFLRLWLLERREQPEHVAVNERLKEAHETAFKKLEEQRMYGTLEERFQDERWTGLYLDLLEQQFWLDPDEGMRYLLPFMIAASIYQRSINQDAFKIAQFFEKCLSTPYHNWWNWAKSLVPPTGIFLLENELASLQELAKLAHQRFLTFPNLAQDYHQELEAALWWRLGEAYAYKEMLRSLEWYEKALIRLGQSTTLKKETAKIASRIADQLYNKKKPVEAINLLNKSIGLDPSNAIAYNKRGRVYSALKEYEQAIADYNHALELDPSYVYAYNNRGYTSHTLKDYKQAIADYTRALELNPSDVWTYFSRALSYRALEDYEQAIADFTRSIELDTAYVIAYVSRGITYLWLKEISLARDNFKHSLELDPKDVNIAWMIEWIEMSKMHADEKIAGRLETIVSIDSEHYVAHICRGVALGLRGKGKEGLEEIEKLILLEPLEWAMWDAYFWKGMLLLYYYRGASRDRDALASIEQALDLGLPPILLTPLYWFERDRPDMFEKELRPLLEKYGV